jgi:hypothetical protein
MKKIGLVLLIAAGSKWFYPVSLVAGTLLGMSAICHYNHCTRDMSKGDNPDPMFHVMMRLPSENNRVVPVLLSDVSEFTKKNPGASLSLTASEGKTEDQSWEYAVVSQGAGQQVIEARHLDSARIDVKYRVSGSSLEPLTSNVMGAGIGFLGLIIGLVITWMVASSARYAKRSLDKA